MTTDGVRLTSRRRWIAVLLAAQIAFVQGLASARAEERPAGIAAPVDFAAAFEQLGRSLERPEFRQPESSEARTAACMLFRLQSLPAPERYALLRSWTMPAGEAAPKAVRHFAGLLPDAPPPAVFLPERLPAYDDPLMSTFALLVEAARATGKLEELAGELEPLIQRNAPVAEFSLEARMLWLLVQLERQRPEATESLLSFDAFDEAIGTTLERAERVKFPHTPGRCPVEQYEYGLVAKAALRSPRTRDLGKRLHLKLLLKAQGYANFHMIVWLNRIGGLGSIAATEGATLRPSPDPGLKHWIPVDVASAASVNIFGSTSWWLATHNRIGHVSSPWVDHLVFAYPLTGSFRVECETFNALWSEANVAYAGLVFEPWNQAGDNQVYPYSGHEIVHGPNPREKTQMFNPVTIEVEPDLLRVHGLGQVLVEDPSPSPTSPFFALRTTWLSAFRRLQITGNPIIPREVRLLDDDRMEGWVSSFYGESQPPSLTLGQPIPNRPGAVVTRSEAPGAYDWSTSEGLLHGRRVADAEMISRETGYRHGESWIYYHRPLREGDRIRYEFFYQPGEPLTEIHPTLDRLAFLLRPDGVQLHWITANRSTEGPGNWLPTDNRAEEPANRRGPIPLPLRANDWNAAAVEIRGEQVRIELNGALVYERPVEPGWGTRFGLYHDRLKSSSRIRNVVLSGDWPEWTRALENGLLDRKTPISAADAEAIDSILTPRLATE